MGEGGSDGVVLGDGNQLLLIHSRSALAEILGQAPASVLKRTERIS